MLGSKFLIVSDEKIAEDLLVKKGKLFIDRPQIPALTAHKQSGEYFALSSPTQLWAKQRQFLHAAIAESSRHEYAGIFESELRRYLCLLLVDPRSFKEDLEDMASRMICRVTWDDAGLSRDNTMSAWNTLEMMSTAGTVANRLTFLNKLPEPINPWRRYENARHAEQMAWWRQCFQVAKKRMETGNLASSSWAFRYLSALKTQSGSLTQSPEEERAAVNLLGFSNLLGVYTVAPQISFLLMAFAQNPEWLVKCQDEIARVCGDRMPTLKDVSRMSVIKACVKETIRWRPNVPLGVPHQALQNFVYRDIEIEKGTTVLPLEWCIARDPVKYPQPEEWRPERWLEQGWPTFQARSSESLSLRQMSAFGWGRRSCVGVKYAEDMLFLTASAMCWGFDFEPCTNVLTGEKVAIDTMASNSFVILSPDAFALSVKPRHRAREQEILASWASDVSCVREGVQS